MPRTDLRKLAGGAGDAILMAFSARCSVEYGTEPCARIMPPFKLGLIECKRITWRLCDTVANTL